MNGIWEKANDISSLAYRISNVKDILELVAEDVGDPYSGAVWACRDILEDLSSKLESQVEDLMRLNALEEQKEQVPKKKKK